MSRQCADGGRTTDRAKCAGNVKTVPTVQMVARWLTVPSVQTADRAKCGDGVQMVLTV